MAIICSGIGVNSGPSFCLVHLRVTSMPSRLHSIMVSAAPASAEDPRTCMPSLVEW